MYTTTILSILIINISIISSTFLDVEYNFRKPTLERNNVINKGIWLKEMKDDEPNGGKFIFRTNSIDAENVLQNNFDTFGENGMENQPGLFSFPDRSKRGTDNERNKILQNNLDECKGNIDCISKENIKPYISSKLMSILKPTSVFNDYPYEVAILLNDYKLEDVSNNIRKTKKSKDSLNIVQTLNSNEGISNVKLETLVKEDTSEQNKVNNTVENQKRSMKNKYESKVIKKIEINEDLHGENQTSKYDKGINEKVWKQISPDNMYKVNMKPSKDKSINEKVLMKVLSMLTRTFKKIMKQYRDIRKIHNKLQNINDEVSRNIVDITKKYQDIEEKYAHIVSLSEKIKEFEANINSKEEHFKTKDNEMAKNLLEFQNQQKKFLIQQKQFYDIQRIMLAQNEKINMKQNMISKSQSEISHRQNHFARILKKTKQIYGDKKYTTNKIPYVKINQIVNKSGDSIKNINTTTVLPTTESIKINLFSIPTLNKLESQDIEILKEKDKQQVDDLVYKYYFNNTFIDTLMKSKILSSFITTPENREISRNVKNKRKNAEVQTTILLPINTLGKSETASNLRRDRRWIRHHHELKSKLKKSAKNTNISNEGVNDEKPLKPTDTRYTNTKLLLKDKTNPFVLMAKSFCNEIGHNDNDQNLDWCVEKSLRRLQMMESKMAIPIISPLPANLNGVTMTEIKDTETETSSRKETVNPLSSTAGSTVTPISASSSTVTPIVTAPMDSSTVFFPDNDELESNLKQYDLKPDTEGNVYYDGSLHASDIAGLTMEKSEGFSDIIPGLDSNSQVDVDPRAFTLQSRRRDFVKRMNANIINNYG